MMPRLQSLKPECHLSFILVNLAAQPVSSSIKGSIMKLKEKLKTGRSPWLPELPQEVPHVPGTEPGSSLQAGKHMRDLSTVRESCNTLPLGRSYYSQPSLLVSVALLEVVIITLLKRQGDSCHAYSKTLLTP